MIFDDKDGQYWVNFARFINLLPRNISDQNGISFIVFVDQSVLSVYISQIFLREELVNGMWKLLVVVKSGEVDFSSNENSFHIDLNVQLSHFIVHSLFHLLFWLHRKVSPGCSYRRPSHHRSCLNPVSAKIVL